MRSECIREHLGMNPDRFNPDLKPAPVKSQQKINPIQIFVSKHMKALLVAAVLVIAPTVTAQQEYASQLDVDLYARLGPAIVSNDSLQPSVVHRLQPENMSLMEKGLWGEGGILRSTGIASPLTVPVRKSELSLRRAMLTAHQIGGFVTFASMLAAVYYGQKSLDDPNSGQRNDPYRNLHQRYVTTTIVLYSATGALAIFSPPPLIRRDELWSTTTIHKTLAWVHVIGMIVTPILGSTILKRGPIGRYVDLNQARYHQISAYATTAVFAASLITVTF